MLALALVSLTSMHPHPAAATDDFILRGVYETNSKLLFSIESRITGRKGWVAANRVFEGLILDSYDSHKMVANGTLNHNEFTLPLLTLNGYSREMLASVSNDGPLTPQAIQEAVKAFSTTTYNNLPPKNHPLYAPMKLSADNQITSFRQTLEAQHLTPTTTTIASNQSEKSASLSITSPIRRNRVNSRIWASDHIELHGLPELQ